MKIPADAIAALLIGGLILSSIAPLAVAGNETVNGIPANETDVYRSEDSDDYVNDTTYSEQFEENRTGLEALANATDIYFSEPPREVSIWNDNDFEQLQADFNTDDDQSIQPQDVTTKDSQFIEEAYVSTYRLSPSTVIHRSKGESIRYLSQNGEAMAVVDYRVDDPLEDLDPSDGKIIEWELLDSEIEQTCIVEDKPPIEDGCSGNTMGETSADTHTPRFNYTVRGTGKQDTAVTVVAEIDVRLKKITSIEKTRTVEVCEEVETDKGTIIECSEETETFWDEKVEYFDDSVIVTDTHDPANTKMAQQVVQKVTHPDGQVDYGVTIEGKPWSTFQADDTLTSTSRWRYYSRSTDSWGTLISKSESGSSEVDLGATPLRVYGFPADQGYTVLGEQGYRSEVEFLSKLSVENPPDLPSVIDVPVANGSYNYTRSFAVKNVGEGHNLSTNTVVSGENATTVKGPPITIREANLEVDIIEENTSYALVEATLTDNKTGDPISLSGRDSAIIIESEAKSTNSTGKAQFRIKKDQYFVAEYNATPWYDTSRTVVYAPVEEYVAVKNTDMYSNNFRYLFKLAIQGGSIVLLVAYLVDVIPWVDIWPPWRKLL